MHDLQKGTSPPTPNKVGFGANWVTEMSAFFGHNIAKGSGGRGGDGGMNPKPNKKLSLEAESYGTIAWKGFFTQSQVLLSSIVVLKTEKGNYLNTNFTKLKKLY